MDFKLIWSESSIEDLGAIVRFVALRDGADIARRIGFGIYDRAQVLTRHPEALFVCWMAFCSATIWGRMAERIYEAKANSPRAIRWLLMGGELTKDRACYVRFARRLAWFQMLFGLAWYTLFLWSNL